MKYLISTFLIIIGLVIIGVAIVGIADPVGTQMANDNDPFGTPPSITQSLVTAIIGALVCLSPYLMFRKPRIHENDTNT